MKSFDSAAALRRITKTAAITAAISAGLGTQLTALPADAASPLGTAGAIAFSAKLPIVHENLPIFRLTHTAAPAALVQSILAAAKAQPLAMNGTTLVAHNAHGALSAYVDGIRGDAEVFPDLGAAPAHGATLSATALQTAAASVLARPDMIPKDATTAKLGGATPVFGSAHQRPGSSGGPTAQSTPQRLFTYVNAMRYAHGLPVVGKSSQAVVAVAGDGSIRGLVRRWQAANVAGTVAPTTTSAQLVAAIGAQLQHYQTGHAQITVNSITPAYYDGGAAYLQPVYTFLATIHGGKVGDDHVVGYVPVGKLVEPIPVLGAPSGPVPSRAAAPARGAHHDANGTTITLGEYANDDGTMLDMADAYNNGFSANSPWWAPGISRTQWYWAQPYDYVGYSNYFANAVDIAYTNPHGDWWLNTTNGNGAGFFYINNIGTNGNPGYGAAAGGILSTWIIDSCEVIPSYYDLQLTTGDGNNAFTPWWPVFQGLHRALGFRTQMLLGQDTMNYQIAYDQAQGADAVSAFFNDVAAVDFNGIYGTYYNAHLGFNVNWDRVSVMIDPQNDGESIYSTQPQGAAGQLSNFWMGD